MSGVDELRSWAKANGLKPQTIEKLLSEDLDSIDSLKVIDKENVSELGLSFGQRHQLLQAVGDLRGKPPQTKAQRKDDSKLGPCPSNHGRARTRESTQHGEETACVVRYRCFERNDRAKVITDVDVSEGIMKDEGIRNVTGATEKEMWQEFSAEGAEGLVTEVDDDGHVRLRLEKRMEKGLLGQQIKAINGVGFPRSVVSLVEQDDIRVGDIVRVVNDSGLMEMSEDTIIGFGHLIGSVVGKLGVVIKPMLYPESSFVVRVGQHNGVFRKTDLVVTENRDVTEFQTSDSDQSENMSHGLAVGDHVRVNVTEKELEKLQFQHGGYIPDMKKAFEKVCFDGKVFKEGDIVRFSDDVEKLKTLQEGHGGWNDGMNLVAGKTGTVKKVLLDNDLLIAAIGTSFRWNPLAVEMSEDPEVKNKVTDRHGISIAVNDVVKVDVEPHQLDSLKHYPKGHLDSIGEEMNAPGVVREIDHDGDLLVHYSSGQRLYLRTELVSKQVEMDASEVDTTAVIEVDDLVLIDSDCDKTAGKVGQVRAVRPMGVFKVDVGGKTWTFAASLIVKADRSEMTKITGRQPTPSLETSAENMEVYAAFARGDRVQIGVDPQTLRNLQEGHGGYSTQMEQSIGSNGSIMHIDDDGDTWVNFPVYSAGFNTKALVKVPVPDEERDRLAVGDFVKICEDKHAVMTRQEGHGGWNEDMEMALGKVGRIDNIDRDGDIVVKAVGRKWIFNPDNLAHVSLQELATYVGNCFRLVGKAKALSSECFTHPDLQAMVNCLGIRLISVLLGDILGKQGSACVCDCGGSDVGCVDCGKCRSCTNECPDRGDRDVDLEIAAKMSSMKDRLDHLHDAFGGMTATFNLATDDTAEEVFGFGKGDVVRVKVTKEELEKLQTEKHGGYNPRQGEMVGATGRVVGFLTGSAIVAFPNAMHCLNPAALEKCAEKEGTKFSKGDFVRVCEDFDKLKQLQELPGRGGFTPDMEAVVGKTGKVTREALNGNIHVNMWSRTWCIHPAALSKISVPCKAEAPNGDVCEGTISPFQPEDVVQVVGSEETLRKQQSCHGGFTGEMAGIVGEHGIVRGVDLDGDVTVSFADGRRWRLNPLSLTKVDPKTVVPIDMRAEIVVRDLVRIDDDEDKAKRLQGGKGNIGWNSNMQNVLVNMHYQELDSGYLL
ncbi:Receptor-interacting serine/threonine-protein kinase 4 [Branchiostoma belcheri]|nr:Receptor-interacting serine/threonine-protein kinase 4 [Branchiostoma belcheri]